MSRADRKREALERNLHRLATEGLDAATDAAIQILKDPKAPSQARSATINAVFRARGLSDRKDEDEKPELHQMTPAQLDRYLAELTRDLEARTLPGESDGGGGGDSGSVLD